jgi:hypothetical protein
MKLRELEQLKTSSHWNEKELVILLSKPILNESEQNKLKALLESHLDWDKVIGMIEIHRVAGVAWNNIQQYFFTNESNQCTYPRLYKYLHHSYQVQKMMAEDQLKYTAKVCELFEKNNIPYVVLKGVVVSSFVYNDLGLRDFNDNDILIHPNHVKEATNLLLQLRYKQGSSSQLTKIKESTRKEKIIRSFSSHEVIPFILNLSNKIFSKQHIIDLHFSVNLMTNIRNTDLLESWLDRRVKVEVGEHSISTLDLENLMLFLCEHFYKEAVSKRDLQMYKDILMYKICDIYYLIRFKDINWKSLVSKAIEIGFQKQLYFTLMYVNEVFGLDDVMDYITRVNPSEAGFLNKVYYYNSTEVAYEYEDHNFINRVFDISKPRKVKITSI